MRMRAGIVMLFHSFLNSLLLFLFTLILVAILCSALKSVLILVPFLEHYNNIV